jgi:hypothetical protein
MAKACRQPSMASVGWPASKRRRAKTQNAAGDPASVPPETIPLLLEAARRSRRFMRAFQDSRCARIQESLNDSRRTGKCDISRQCDCPGPSGAVVLLSFIWEATSDQTDRRLRLAFLVVLLVGKHLFNIPSPVAHCSSQGENWSGRRESNPRMQLGKLPFCH